MVVRFLYMTSFYFKRNCGRLRGYCIIDWLASWHCERTSGKSLWNDEMFKWFCEEVRNGALFNRAATEPKTGSPTRGGKPETIAVQQGEKWVINGRKTLQRWRQYLIILLFQQVWRAKKKLVSLSFQEIQSVYPLKKRGIALQCEGLLATTLSYKM